MDIDIGRKIQKKRQQLGISQCELAKQAGIAQSTLSYIEKNKKRPHFDTMSAICRVLGITVLDLLTFEEQPSVRKFFEETIAAHSIPADSGFPKEASLRIQAFEKYLYDLYMAQTGA